MRSKQAQKEAKKLEREQKRLAKKEEKALKKAEKENAIGTRSKKSFGSWFKNLKAWKKILLITLVVILVAAIVCGTVLWDFFQTVLGQMNDVEEDPTTPVDVPELEVDEGFLDYEFSVEPENGYVNILLLGIDSRNMKSFTGSRSDMMIIASINQETNDVKLVSIYRDTYTKIGNTSTYQRANTGIFFGGINMCLDTLSQMTDINLNKYVVVNFQIVCDVVDAIGGVEVDIQDYELKELNRCIKAGCEELGDVSLYVEVPGTGKQTLCGVQALGYGRMRMNVGGDTKRTERMRIIINAVVDKVKTMSLKEIKSLVYLITPKVKTNLKTSDVLALGINLTKYNFSTGSGWPVNWRSAEYDDMSLIFPTSLESNVKWLHNYLFGKSNYQPSQRLLAISNQIAEYYQEALFQEAGNTYAKDSNGDYILTRDGQKIVISNGVVQGNWKLNSDGSIYLDEDGYPVELPSGGENPGTDPGTDNPGGNDNPGTDNPGGNDNPGTDNPGGNDNPGTDNPGGNDNPGTDNPGGNENPGTDNPGGNENPGTDNPGGNENPSPDPDPNPSGGESGSEGNNG